MKYKDLLNKLQKLNESQLNSDLTILNIHDMEFYKGKLFFSDDNTNDILDNDHPYIAQI
jgi:hypothetical protein